VTTLAPNEALHCAEWIVSHLESDTGPGGLFDPTLPADETLSGAYFEVIPGNRPLPAIRFHTQDMHDVRQAMGGPHRIMVSIDWLICVVNEGLRLSQLVLLADRLDDRLHESNGETSTVRVMQCVRIEPFSQTEPEDSGVTYRHVGGIYRTIVQAK
jgi:hypothetical protein